MEYKRYDKCGYKRRNNVHEQGSYSQKVLMRVYL